MYLMNETRNLAATLMNVGSKLKFIDEGDPLPLAFRLGGSFEASKRWLVSSDVVYRKTGLASWHGGVAWRPLEPVSLRVGYRTDTLKGLDALAGLSAGLGIHVWNQELAYTWVPYGDLGNTNYFSLVLRFGEADEAKRNLIRYHTIKKHRTVKDGKKDKLEPEYQQLMQLLNDGDDSHLARTER